VYRPISKGAFYRLAQRAGNKRVSGLVYEESRGLLRKYVDRIVGRAVVYMEHSKRKTLKTKDVLASLQGIGHDLYGFQ
jgi:histone H4